MARRKHDIARGNGFIDERVTKSGEARYRARWHEGRSLKSKTFGTIHDAEDHLRRVGRSKSAGTYEPESRLTVATMLAEYFERMRREWTSNTYANYVTIRDNIIVPAIGKRIVAQIRPRDMRIFMDRLQAEYSPSRVVVVRAVLSGAFREAVEMDIISRNPLADIRIKQPEQPDIIVWTTGDVRKLMAHIANSPRDDAWYRLALTTGMRPGEMRALAWSAVDVKDGTVLVSDTASRDERYRPIIKKSTKTGKARRVKIPPATVEALRKWRSRHIEERLRADSWQDNDLVFPGANGSLMPQQSHARHHREVCLAAGVPYLRPHGMRHTVATLLLEDGTNDKLVASILGHTRTRTTNQLYNHPTRRAHEAAADFLESSFQMGEKGESMGESSEGGTGAV